jgi:hypothetical protein
MDMTDKTDQQLQNLIDNHRRAEKLNVPLAVAAVEEQARRNTAFDFEAGIEVKCRLHARVRPQSRQRDVPKLTARTAPNRRCWTAGRAAFGRL